MKIRYVGEYPIACVDFEAARIIPSGEALEPGKVYDVPEDDLMFISMLKASPLFVEEKPTKKPKGDK